MQKIVSCFCVTDGRPWYKQIVSGIYIFIGMAVVAPFAFIAVAIPIAAISEIGFGGVAVFLVKCVGWLFAILTVFILLIAGWCWSTDEWDS